MKDTGKIGVLVALTALVASWAAAAAAEEETDPAGKTAFIEHKCNMCHAVPAAGIEAKTKSEKMRGDDQPSRPGETGRQEIRWRRHEC